MADNSGNISEENPHWQRNLWVCTLGSFSTLIAMSLLLPFLPLYLQSLGVKGTSSIAHWSAVAYGATFLTAALTAPLWGRLADIYGRKLMLIRASLGMAIAMSLMGMATAPWQLVALRLLAGLLGGYASGSMILVAAQTPKKKTGYAIGILSGGIMAGNIVGPLAGGVLPGLIGIRETFLLTGGIIFLAFLGTLFFLKEERQPARHSPSSSAVRQPAPVAVKVMWVSAMLLIFATMSVEPIITLYVASLMSDLTQATLFTGIIMASTALGSIISAPRIGALADRTGHWRVLCVGLLVCGVLLIPQAFVTAVWQLLVLRFLMGLALGGMLPCITAIIRHHAPAGHTGRLLGYSTSAQYIGQVCGPLFGGVVAGQAGMPAVFLGTAIIMLSAAGINRVWYRKMA
ncbi:multidrug efflux MFS transporter [Tatumella terrea]|uniref:MFS transporter n=1 Tax=Tatumella terrea TaxID=419007 RepID=UPI0031E13422